MTHLHLVRSREVPGWLLTNREHELLAVNGGKQMISSFLLQSAVFLAAAAIAAPIAKKLNISSVLGYLAAGVLIGPYGLGFIYSVYQVESILHIAEYGVALLLFLIGLELRPIRLWTMP